MVPVNTVWYLASVLHYMGNDLWAVGLLKRELTDGKLSTHWDWVENLTWQQAVGFQTKAKPHMVRTTNGELRRQLNAP